MATMQQAMADWAKQHNDDLEDRAAGAAGNHGFYTKRAHERGGGRGVEGALCSGLLKDADYKTIVLD